MTRFALISLLFSGVAGLIVTWGILAIWRALYLTESDR